MLSPLVLIPYLLFRIVNKAKNKKGGVGTVVNLMTSVPDCLLTAQAQCRENGYANQKVEHEVEGEPRKRRTLRLVRVRL